MLVHWCPHWSKYRLTSPRSRRAGPHCSCGGDGSVAFPFSSCVGFHGRSLTFSKPAAACAAMAWCCRAGCLQKCPCPALVPSLRACGRPRFGAGHKGWTGWEGRAGAGIHLPAGEEGWPLHSSHRRRFVVGKKHLWGLGGLFFLRKHRKLKDAPPVLYPSSKYSALCPLDVRKKMWLKR